ncbi:alpha/beta fold hydrolase [Conexibacter sp. SYSU D00693]|uniref:lipase family alpha/beta hydrolase n=1 Tax=Conexibacter sp. SYSU D00693 TaxID=2812560 RepID=UPI00196B4A36|nr:alpha/beta fold hydrolase [Conexibacter sp. SYSU D00693]
MRGGVLAAVTACALLAGGATTAASAASQGVNDWTCEPSAEHPRPLVLVHGLGANGPTNWGYLAPRLAQAGWCVYFLTYGVDPRTALLPYRPGGTIPMERSAPELRAFVDRVLASTGASQVDLVGHSEGTVMPRYYLERLGGAPKVKRFVALTPLWRGTDVLGLATLKALAPPVLGDLAVKLAVKLVASLCGSCPQFLKGSAYLNDLNADGEAVPGIEHTNIMTRYDELVQPYTSGVMRDGGTNVVVQDVCPGDLSEHALVAFDPVVLQLVRNALDPGRAAPVRC